MVLNEEQWIKELREKRIAYGISQGRLAVASGITREYLNKIESGKMKPSKELLETLHKELARFNPEAPLTMLFDYVKIRFPTLDIQHIIKDILKLNINYMLHEDYGHYSYTEHYSLGDIFIYTSADEEKGVLLELKGRGCRQFESYLLAQQRSWYDFLMDALVDGGVMKRIEQKIFHCEIVVDAEKVKREESAYKKIPVITNFTDEDGNDRMKETVQANYRRIKEEVKQIVQEELERIKNDPVLCKLLPDNETV